MDLTNLFLGFVIVPEYHHTTLAPLPPFAPFLSSCLSPLPAVPLTSLTSRLLFFRSFSTLSRLLFFFIFYVTISSFPPPVRTPSRFPLACGFVTAYVIRSVVTCFLVSLCIVCLACSCLLSPLRPFFIFLTILVGGTYDDWWGALLTRRLFRSFSPLRETELTIGIGLGPGWNVVESL